MTDPIETAVANAPVIDSAPVSVGERIAAIDVLRGVALLGILVINIDFFALPNSTYHNPALAGGFDGMNLLMWRFTSAVFCQKMMAIFSMLFGAGLLLMYQRFEESGRKFGGFYYRRVLWLMAIALVHAYLIWHGDILFTYAFVGLFMFLFRRRNARTMIIVGICFLLVGMFMSALGGGSFMFLEKTVASAEKAREEGKTLTLDQQHMMEAWDEVQQMAHPSEEKINEEYESFRGGYLDNLEARAPLSIIMQTQALLFLIMWRVAGLMLLGMGLMKLGVFSALKSTKFYVTLGAICYAVGLPLSIYGTETRIAHEFDLIHGFLIGNHFDYVGSVLVAIGHACLIMLICKHGLLTGLTKRLAAVGRMALSNYLMHSIICTTIFYGFGFGLFGHFERFALQGFVVSIWIVQLILSPWWLSRFRFGPVEWLWRTLTYMKKQPMRVGAES